MSEAPRRKDAERNRQRILAAARELFTERGLGVTLHDIARHADVGVGTVYRHFPDRSKLIEALFEQRLHKVRELLETTRNESDPWQALVDYHERLLDMLAADRGLRELLLAAPDAPERLSAIQLEFRPLVAELVNRAHGSGQLRTDCRPEDLSILHLMLSAVIEASAEVAPELWRRYLAILLQGLKAEPGTPRKLTTPPVPAAKINDVLLGANKRRRGRQIDRRADPERLDSEGARR